MNTRILTAPAPGVYIRPQDSAPLHPEERFLTEVLRDQGTVLFERRDLSHYQARRIAGIISGKWKLPIFDTTQED